MRKIIIAFVAVVALAGCQTLDTIDAYIKKNLPVACQGVELANTAFFIAHGVRQFNATILASEKAAYDKAKNICDHPEAATSVSIVTAVFEVAILINSYIRQAEAAGVE